MFCSTWLHANDELFETGDLFLLCVWTIPISPRHQFWLEGVDATLINGNYFFENLGLILYTRKAAVFSWRSFMAIGEKIMVCWNITCQKRTLGPRNFWGVKWHSAKSYPLGDAFLQQIQLHVPFLANTTHNGTADSKEINSFQAVVETVESREICRDGWDTSFLERWVI